MISRQAPLRLLTALAVLLLFGSRWVSYIGISPIFLSDVLLLVTFIVWLLSNKKNESYNESSGDPAKRLLTMFSIWAMIRGIFSFADGYPLLDVLRDFVPFVYVLIAFLVASQLRDERPEIRLKINTWIHRGLGLHLAWCLVAVFSGNSAGLQIGSELFEGGLFAFRPDIDTTLVVIYFVLVLRRWELGYQSLLSALQLAGCLAVVSFSPARSSLLALLICLIWFLGTRKGNSQQVDSTLRKSSRKLIIFVGALVATFTVGFTAAGARLLSTVGVIPSGDSSLSSSALGTANARELVWTQVLDWVNSSTSSIFLGSGFGINFLDVTQTLQFLEGTTYTGVRSPHNFLITLIARLGWPATLLFVMTIAIILYRNRKAADLDELGFAAMTIVLAFIPISLLGVILEAPFGAIPFYFALGVLLQSNLRKISKSEENT